MASPWDPTEESAPSRGLLGEFWVFLWENKAWWITPCVLILLFIGAVVFMSKDSSVAPFIYALF